MHVTAILLVAITTTLSLLHSKDIFWDFLLLELLSGYWTCVLNSGSVFQQTELPTGISGVSDFICGSNLSQGHLRRSLEANTQYAHRSPQILRHEDRHFHSLQVYKLTRVAFCLTCVILAVHVPTSDLHLLGRAELGNPIVSFFLTMPVCHFIFFATACTAPRSNTTFLGWVITATLLRRRSGWLETL